MNTIEKATILHYHRELIGERPSDRLYAQGWKTAESQQKRFEVLAQIADLDHCTVMDIGCGYGDLKAFLDKKFTGFTYLGTDHLPEFIAEAENIYAGVPDTYFYRHDFMTDGFPEADYIFASGSLNYRSENELFPYNIIRKMYASARKGIAFNLPDKDFQQPGNYLGAYDQVTVINFCRTLSPDWQVINGYLPGDFTLFVYKK